MVTQPARKMIRPKKKYICQNCHEEYPKMMGQCRHCGSWNTLLEVILISKPIKPRATLSQKSLHRRAKNSERNGARRLQEIDGPDPNFKNIASSTGRVGHITNMRIDGITRSYAQENKNRVLPKWIIDAWLLLNQRGITYNKNIVLRLDPPNMPKSFLAEGVNRKLDTLAVITQTRHEDLIKTEQSYNELLNLISTDKRYKDLLDVILSTK